MLESDPDGLVAAQWVLLHPHADPAAGPRRLMLAMLVDAVRVASRTRDLAAHAWIDSEDENWPFSFRNVCAALDVSPDRIRRSIATARLSGVGTHMRCARALQKLSHRTV